MTLAHTSTTSVVAVCEAGDVRIEVHTTGAGGNFVANVQGGPSIPGSFASGSPGLMYLSPVGQFTRGNYDLFNGAGESMDGQFLAFASGSGCEQQATTGVAN